MPAFDYILLLLAAVLLSNLINRFIPVLSPPIVQILLGVVITIIHFGVFDFDYVFEPDLFLVLFIAPLVFHSSMTADKNTLWRLKKPIIGAAVLLVLITVVCLGYFVHTIIPVIPLAAAFALVSALGPTDVVAVDAVARRIAVPREIMGVLSGESIVNDAMGIVCFQFAITAAMTGTFSVVYGLLRFLILGIGGILAGLIMAQLKYLLIHWLRVLGVENITLHIMIDALTPFIIYLCAEALSVSGVLAVFAAGIFHSFRREKFNPDTVKLQITQESIWSVLTFSLDGLVFVILGTQLPGIFQAISGSAYSAGDWKITGYVLLITFSIILIRFIWWVLFIHNNKQVHSQNTAGRAKSGVIFSLAGARGTVTLAIVMSLPLFSADGIAFPARNLLILIAGGVIVVTLLVTNFILPLFAEKKTDKDKDEEERAAYTEIMQTVISRLKDAVTPETRGATFLVTRTYYSRANQRPVIRRKGSKTEEEKDLRREALLWEKENTMHMLEDKKTSEEAAEHMMKVLDVRIEMSEVSRKHSFLWFLKWFVNRIVHGRRHESIPDGKEFWELSAADAQFVLDRLHSYNPDESNPAAEKIAAEYEVELGMSKTRADNEGRRKRISGDMISKIAAEGFQIERELIQQMFEEGRLSRETTRKMRDNIAILETKLQAD